MLLVVDYSYLGFTIPITSTMMAKQNKNYIRSLRGCALMNNLRLKIDEQLEQFYRAHDLFRYIMAVETQDKKQSSNMINIIYFNISKI